MNLYKPNVRYDFFLIWGHGLLYHKEIIEFIRSQDSLRILKIMRHTTKDIAQLVRVIYSNDYAPFEHLKTKTKYLLGTNPTVLFIFVHNYKVQEVYRGEGSFRHIECDNIRSIKEEIRDRFNPRVNGLRTEDHVVHASDNESQVHQILKYLGHQEGIRVFQNVPNPILQLPYYLPQFSTFVIRTIDIDQLYCSILTDSENSYVTKPLELTKSPQYVCVTGNPKPYQEYLAKYLGGPLTADYSITKLLELSSSLTYLQGKYLNAYILVRELRPEQYLILDGVHRASVLKSRGVEKLPVAIVEK